MGSLLCAFVAEKEGPVCLTLAPSPGALGSYSLGREWAFGMHRTEDPHGWGGRGKRILSPSLQLAGCVTLDRSLPVSGHLSGFLISAAVPWRLLVQERRPGLAG